jgi:NAD(P)-dependent dehydrogenase (short-subunit alcohol dehydrogenase family)
MNASPAESTKRVFDSELQEQFAQFSGDRNPMHMDAILARRTHAGQPVVHGMHTVLWALETLALQGELPPALLHIKVKFQKLIYVGDEVEIQIERRDSAGILMQLCVDGSPLIAIKIMFGEMKHSVAPENGADEIPPPDWPEEPIEHSLGQIEQAGGWLSFARDVRAAEPRFPALSGLVGPQRVSALACMSRLVGMVCPGMHSTFFGLTIQMTEPCTATNAIHYRVASVHDQFRLVKQNIVGGGWSGTVESIARIPPVAQPALEGLAGLVGSGEFAGATALIIGGSRGLGELTAKLIAVGGGAVTITYAVGRKDAIEVQRQIRARGGKCEVMQFDAMLPAAEQLTDIDHATTSVYYFATSSIFVRKTKLYMPDVFKRFYRVYVDSFYEVCTSVLRSEKSHLSIFYPSSVAVADRPADMTEYAMAKAAGEILCADLARSSTGSRVIVERLPRMLTDQTATTMAIKTASPLEVMLPIVRRMEARDGS